ncbi:MAG: Ig-like domain-containing protein [Bacteroidales bacterium]|nr:Ig-like domain-containing protein [Bacteroidales bacterium]
MKKLFLFLSSLLFVITTFAKEFTINFPFSGKEVITVVTGEEFSVLFAISDPENKPSGELVFSYSEDDLTVYYESGQIKGVAKKVGTYTCNVVSINGDSYPLTIDAECMDLHIGDEETGLSRRKDDLLNLRCFVGKNHFETETERENYSFEWYSDETITWDSYKQGSNYDYDAYMTGSEIGNHTVYCKVTDKEKGCSSTKSINVGIYRAQLLGYAFVNFDDVAVNKDEDYTGLFTFSETLGQLFSESEQSVSFFVKKDGSEEFELENEIEDEINNNLDSKEYEFHIYSGLEIGEYSFGFYSWTWGEVLFEGKLTVKPSYPRLVIEGNAKNTWGNSYELKLEAGSSASYKPELKEGVFGDNSNIYVYEYEETKKIVHIDQSKGTITALKDGSATVQFYYNDDTTAFNGDIELIILPASVPVTIEHDFDKGSDDYSGPYASASLEATLDLGSLYTVNVIHTGERQADLVSLEIKEYSDILSMEEGKVFAMARGGEYVRAIFSNDSVVNIYFTVEANTEEWTLAEENITIEQGEEYEVTVLNSNGNNVSKYVCLAVTDMTEESPVYVDGTKIYGEGVGSSNVLVYMANYREEFYYDEETQEGGWRDITDTIPIGTIAVTVNPKVEYLVPEYGFTVCAAEIGTIEIPANIDIPYTLRTEVQDFSSEENISDGEKKEGKNLEWDVTVSGSKAIITVPKGLNPGYYSCKIFRGDKCVASVPVFVQQLSAGRIYTEQEKLYVGEEIQFYAEQCDFNTYEWTCENATLVKDVADGEETDYSISGVKVTCPTAGEYVLKLTIYSNAGCSDSDEYTFNVVEKPEYKITPEKIAIRVGDEQSLELYEDGVLVEEGIDWRLENQLSAEDANVASVYDNVLYGEYAGTADLVAYLFEDSVAYVPVTVMPQIEYTINETFVCYGTTGFVHVDATEAIPATITATIEDMDGIAYNVTMNVVGDTASIEIPASTNAGEYNGYLYDGEKTVGEFSLTIEKVDAGEIYLEKEASILREGEVIKFVVENTSEYRNMKSDWICENAELANKEFDGVEVICPKAGDYLLKYILTDEDAGCSGIKEYTFKVSPKADYKISPEKLALIVGESQDLELLDNGIIVQSNDLYWTVLGEEPIASINYNTVYAEAEGFSYVVAYIGEDSVAAVPLTVTKPKYYINPERPQIVVNQDTVTVSLYNSKGQKIGFSSSFIEEKNDAQGPSLIRFDMETDFDNDVVKVWAIGNVGGVGILTLGGREGEYEFFEEFELDAIFNGNEYHINDMYLTVGTEGQKIRAYNQNGEPVDMPEYTINGEEPSSADTYNCQLLGDECFTLENGMIVPTACGYGRVAFYNSIGLVCYFQVFVTTENDYIFSGLYNDQDMTVGTEGYLSLQKLVETDKGKDFVDAQEPNFVSSNPNVITIEKEDSYYKYKVLSQGTTTITAYDGDEVAASQVVNTLGETLTVQKEVLLSQKEISLNDVFGENLSADIKWEVEPYVGETSAVSISGNTVTLNDAGVITLKGDNNSNATLFISEKEGYMVLAGAHLSNGTAISSNSITLNYGLASAYGESEQAYLYAYKLPSVANGEFEDIVSEEVTWKASAENVVELKRTSIGEAYIFPLDTTATVTLTAYYQEKELGNVTVNTVGKKIEEKTDYSIVFSEQIYKVKVNESASVCYTLGSSFEVPTFPVVYASDNSIAQIVDEVSTVMNCITVKGLQPGETTLIAKVVTADTTYLAEVTIVVASEEMKPQFETPGYNTNELSICYKRSGVNTVEPAISLESMVFPTSEMGMVQWYDNAGNKLTKAPLVNTAAVGTTKYYVSQVAYDATIDWLESEKVPYTVTISYVPEPTLNMYDQKICDGTDAQAFEAKTKEGNTIKWLLDGQVVGEGNSFLPTESGSFEVYVYNEETGCSSDKTTVTYMVGSVEKPEVAILSQKIIFAPGETVELFARVQDTISSSIVWKINNEITQGQTAAVSFKEAGSHNVVCQAIDKFTGCVAESVQEITVEETHVPVTSMIVNPEVLNMYVNEKQHISLSFEPEYATNKNYTIEIADTTIANVSGLSVIALKSGETKAVLTSKDNSQIKKELVVNVKEEVVAREISMPKIITMTVGEQVKVQASVLPANASKNKISFMKKTDNSVVSISSDGILTAIADGITTITAYTEGGLQASAVVYVTSSIEEITAIQVPEKIEMKVGDSVAVSYKVTPTTLAVKDLNWDVENSSIVSFSNGVVKALEKGETKLTVSYKQITKEITLVVNSSSAPVVTTVPDVVMNPDGNSTVDLSDFVSDENGFDNLKITTESENFNVNVDEDGKLTIAPKTDSYVGKDTVKVVVTNEEGLSSVVTIPTEVKESENKAPIVKLHEVLMQEGETYKYIELSDIAEDDMTDANALTYTFTVHKNGIAAQQQLLARIMKKTQLRLVKAMPFEQDTIFISVSDGVNITNDTIVVYVGSIPNKAPKIAEIPVQIENDEVKFSSIDLTKYVTDDYTTPSAISWTVSKSENLAISIANGKATVTVLNEFWSGAEAITFVAKDEEGLADSTIVYYNRMVKKAPAQAPETSGEIVAVWEGAPVFDVMTMKTIGTPGSQFVLMASLSGYNCTWSWDIPGAKGIDPTSLMQFVTFDKPGVYDVTFTVESEDGLFSQSLTKENFLTVVGIQERNLAICQGQSATLNATDGVNSYYWSTNEVAQSINVRPEKTATYSVTMKKGMFTLIDSVTVKVSVPVSLMEDSVMCAGTTFMLEVQGEYDSYIWNTGAETKSIEIPAVVESYSVFAVDSMNCESIDTFAVTKINELPKINLGEDLTPCDGEEVALSAGTGFEKYLWSTGATDSVIVLTEGTSTVWAQITDANYCVNSDTVMVAFKYPYPEQIGVATFSETTDHIIIAWEKTKDVNTVSYRVERETDVTDNWEQVGDDVKFEESGIVVDEDVNYKRRAYKYRLVTVDGCDNEAVSEIHRSMISTTTLQDNGLKVLQWCAYEPMENVTQYLILRGTDATKMDTVDRVPASNLYEIWNETDPSYKGDDIKYRVVFRLKSEIDENAYKTLEGQTIAGAYTKAESGPFSLAMSNIAEAENEETGVEIVESDVDVVVYPTKITSMINVAIASPSEDDFMIEVVNSKGQVVAHVEAQNVSKTLVQIPADGLTQGLYNVSISNGTQVRTVKVIK